MPETNKKMTEVMLGAGDWYAAPYTSGVIDLDNVEVEENMMGNTQGGATITYTPETYTIEDDQGRVRRTFMTKADAEMKTGLLTYTLKSLAALLSVGLVTETQASADARGKTTVKLGGGHSALRRFVVLFVYTDTETGFKTRVAMIATNTAPLTLTFSKDKETVPDMTFKAESNGVDDTIVIIEQETAEKTGT